jgi:F-type H+-transporting ATPase subunit c
MLQASKYIGAGLATAGLTGAGVGIGLIFQGLLTATARNPSLRSSLFSTAILAFSLCEVIALLALMVCFLILYS